MKNILLIFALLAINIQVLQAQVGIGTTLPNSTLTVDGSFSATATILSADTTLDETHYMVWSNGHVVTLPDGALCPGRIYIIKSGTSATVTPAGANTIDGSNNSITLASDEFITVQSLLGGAWVITTTTGAKEINDLSDGKTVGSPGYSLYLGEFAGGAATSTVPYNTGVGIAALGGNTANGKNTAIGYGAGGNITTGQLNIMLGYETHSSADIASNELNIGKAIYGTNIYNVGAARIGINQQAPNSSLSVNGSLSLPQKTGGTYTLTDNDYTYFLNTNQEVTLPTAVGIEGRIYIIKRLAFLGNGTVLTTGSETIDGHDDLTLNQGYEFIKVQSDGSNWMIIGQN